MNLHIVLFNQPKEPSDIYSLFSIQKGAFIMENKMFSVTKEEQKAIAERTEEAASAVRDAANIREGLTAYAAANGYSEEAADLIDKIVIPTVDTYNASCRDAFEGDVRTWIAEKMTTSIEKQGLNEQEAARYKLGVLLAVQKLNAGAVGGEDEELTEDEKAMLESETITPEMMLQIDEALIDSIEDSAIPLYMTDAFETFLVSKADTESIRVVTTELWKDNSLRYCAATAACVARRNGQLPSIPDETSDTNLVLGTCQGVDVVNIETKVSTGEMTADTAYKILKVIGAVVLTLAVATVLWEALTALLGLSISVAFSVFGTGIIGAIAAGVLMCGSISGIGDMFIAWLEKGIAVAGKAADIAYAALKRGAKTVYQYTLDHVLPAIISGVAKVKEIIFMIVGKVVQTVRGKTEAFAKA